MGSEDEPEDSEIDEDISVLEKSLSEETERNGLSQCFSKLGVSPIKAHAQPESTRVKAVKRKLETAVTALQEKVARTLMFHKLHFSLRICKSSRHHFLRKQRPLIK